MNWILRFLSYVWQKFLGLFGRGKSDEFITTITGKIVLDDLSKQSISEMAENLSVVETKLIGDVYQKISEAVGTEMTFREREIEAQKANDLRMAQYRDQRLLMRAEAIRREQDRLDKVAESEQDRLRFEAEQEQMRLNNEQARAQEQEKRERKEKQAAERREQKERDKQKRSEARKVFWANSREQFKSFWSAATPWFGQAAGSKRVRQFVAALLLLPFVYGLYATEISQTWLYQVLSIVETNQMTIIGLLAAALLSVFVYWLVKTDRWQSVLSFVVSQRKSFGIMALIAAIVGLNYTFYQWGYLSVWSTQASAWLMENWQYCWYALVVLMAVLVIWFWSSKRFVNARQSLRNVGVNTGSNINSFVRNLSIATGVLFAIGLSFVAIFGAFIGTSWIILGSIGLIPVVAFSWRPSIGLWFRCLLSFVLEILAVSAFLPSAY